MKVHRTDSLCSQVLLSASAHSLEKRTELPHIQLYAQRALFRVSSVMWAVGIGLDHAVPTMHTNSAWYSFYNLSPQSYMLPPMAVSFSPPRFFFFFSFGYATYSKGNLNITENATSQHCFLDSSLISCLGLHPKMKCCLHPWQYLYYLFFKFFLPCHSSVTADAQGGL